MQVVDGTDELMTAEQWEEKKLSEGEGDSEGAEPVDKPEATKPESPKKPENPEKPETDAHKQQEPSSRVTNPAKPKTPAKAEASIQVKIPSGNNLSDVANSLLNAGVIDNKQAFIKNYRE